MSLYIKSTHRSGFTLVELLITVGVMIVLVGLIVSALVPARVSAQKTQCASNLRQIGMALNVYAQEHENEFPPTAHDEDGTSWFQRLLPFLDNAEKVGICPADPLGAQRYAAGMSSYILNEYVAVPLTDPFGRVKENFRNRLTLTRPDQTMIVFPSSDGLGLNASHDHTHSRKWKNWPAVLADIQPDRFRTGRPGPEHAEGQANYLYADGHVETHEAKWLQAEIEAKRNPAQPIVE